MGHSFNSCFYEGRVTHERRTAVHHRFEQKLFLAYLDLEELEEFFRTRRLWSRTGRAVVGLRREDYPGPAELSLDEAVRRLVAERTGTRPNGPIRLLTQLRYFGHAFNPASFFYCFDERGDRLEAVVVHVTNTPWGERHSYVVRPDGAPEAATLRAETDKKFHVSPFMPMDLRHDFSFSMPGETLSLGIVDKKDGDTIFAAGLSMRRETFGAAQHARLFLRHCFPGLRTLAGIYWQAFRLYLKGAAYHPHPGPAEPHTTGVSTWRHSNR